MPAALPQYPSGSLANSALADAAPGHRFGLYYAGWNDDFSKPKTGSTPTLKAICSLPNHSRDLLAALHQRQQAAAQADPDTTFSLPCLASSPFATGLGNEHPLENGFSFLTPYGLPYLPGSGVKGVIRKAAEELASGDWGDTQGWTDDAIRALFGPGEEDFARDRETPARQGALRFWDVFPQAAPSPKNDKPLLAVDIMTPHLGGYYQGGATPNTSLQPNPISFLTVAAGSRFHFHIECQPARLAPTCPTRQNDWKSLLDAAFAHAGKWLGFGAKTAVGYGRMQLDPAVAEQREQARADAAARRQAEFEAAQRAALPVDQWLLAELDTQLALLKKDPRNGQPIVQPTSIPAWNDLINWLQEQATKIDGIDKSAREGLAAQIKKRLGTHFKIEGKAEKSMKEYLALVRGQ